MEPLLRHRELATVAHLILSEDLQSLRHILALGGAGFALPVRIVVSSLPPENVHPTRPAWTTLQACEKETAMALIHINPEIVRWKSVVDGRSQSNTGSPFLRMVVVQQLGAAWMAGFAHEYGPRYWLDLETRLGADTLADVLGMLFCHWLHPEQNAHIAQLASCLANLPPWEDLRTVPPELVIHHALRCILNRIGSHTHFRRVMEHPDRDPLELVLELEAQHRGV